MDPFLTVYNRDYKPKPLKPTLPFSPKSEFKDPLNEAFRTFLRLQDDKKKAQLQYPEEDSDEYLEKLKKCYSYLANSYYRNPIDKSILERSFMFNGRTVYQMDYCDIDEEIRFKQEIESKRLRLPDDWDIPVTTQKWAYRDPKSLNPAAAKPPPAARPKTNLDPDETLRKILKVSTGKTEYQAEIGELGNIIIEDALHGKVVHFKCKHHGR